MSIISAIWTTAFTLLEPHDRLIVEATSELEVKAAVLPDFAASPAWESVRDSLPSITRTRA